mmetsp:Transcript_44580/g.110510  ORF Transcript_44580/g.110510 Transcript_44580/m.110510 type:complete len:256 (-) Transcript_44580:339-1106(-)
MFISHTPAQIAPIRRESNSPNLSRRCLSGEGADLTSNTWAPILPISVHSPVAVTNARAEPYAMVVPANSIGRFACISTSSSAASSVVASFATLLDSPVSMDCSTLSVVESTSITRASAGTRSPTFSRITSPGTNSRARMVRSSEGGTSSPSSPFVLFLWIEGVAGLEALLLLLGEVELSVQRRTIAESGSYALRASIALAAFVSWTAPTRAFRTRMVKMTAGSASARSESMSSVSASTNDTNAATSRILTRLSSN